jgi:hypothetical protein
MARRPPVVKTQIFIDEDISTWNTKIITILSKHTREPVYWICHRQGRWEDQPRIKIRANQPGKYTVAGVRFSYTGREFRVIAARHPDEEERSDWTPVRKGHTWGFAHLTGRHEYDFKIRGKNYIWRK